jgi:hypothetical protein
MSDEVISIEEVVAYSLDTFPGLIEDWHWGERSLFYNPDCRLPKGTYFLTFKERDGLTTPPPESVPATTDSMLAFRRSRLLIGSVQCQRDRQLVGWSRLGMISVSGIGSCRIRSTGGCVGLQS